MQGLGENLKQRFKKEYLGFLRSLINSRAGELQVGDVVLVGSDDKKRLDWPIARVEEMYPGQDQISRLVKVRTARGTQLRPIQRLYPLDLQKEQPDDLNASCEKDPIDEVEHSPETVPTVESTSSQDGRTTSDVHDAPADVAAKTRSDRLVKRPERLTLLDC